MPTSRPPSPLAFRNQMVELVRVGWTPEELPKEFEPTAQTIRNWVAQADRDEGRRHDAMGASCFATLACALLDRQRLHSHNPARTAIFSFIEGWYNPRRRHSSLDSLSHGV